MRSRRQFTREFKRSVLNEAEQNGFAQTCREYNLVPSLLSKWKREYKTNPDKAFNGNGKIWKEDARISQYERLLGQAHAEIAFLKKTLEFLQRQRAEEKRKRLSE